MKGCGRAREFVDALSAGESSTVSTVFHCAISIMPIIKNKFTDSSTVILTALILVAGNTERNGSKECEEYGITVSGVVILSVNRTFL